MDFSTLDLDRLLTLPQWTPILGRKLQDSPGNGCAGDPPGYPTYFTRSVYTAGGNSPPNGTPQMVITYGDKHYIVDDGNIDFETFRDRLHALWKPLPLDHERSKLWLAYTYKHHQHCYAGFGDSMQIYPVPYYKLRSYRDDPRWKDEIIASHRQEVDEANAAVIAQVQEIATPDNHNAVLVIRRFYPDYQPDLALIATPPDKHPGSWWETLAVQPSEAECASSQRWGFKHPFNGTWCQWCGRHSA